ncbi:gluconeogenesis factor YvcK family protein [Thalassiella azotivora]
MRGRRVVALGGGHGLAASLSALRHLTDRLTAVVTVADDGGSSGRLRRELGVLPPGDLRMALSALCEDGEWGSTWRDVMQHRFRSDGPLDQHAVGNLLIAALWELLGDPVQGLDLVGRLLGCRGRVLPMSTVPMDIEADVEGLGPGPVVVRGQAHVATTPGRVTGVRLLPEHAVACPEAVTAVRQAEWVVLGPGSWFTSVMPHLLVPGLREALVEGSARTCLTMNLSSQTGETRGLSAAEHVRAVARHAPDLRVDVVLADPRAVDDVDDLVDAAQEVGGQVLLRQVSSVTAPAQHDPLRLAAALQDVLDRALGDT